MHKEKLTPPKRYKTARIHGVEKVTFMVTFFR